MTALNWGKIFKALVVPFVAVTLTSCAEKQPVIRLIATTTTENSGLMAHLLPRFTESTGLQVQLVTMGTGQAVRTAANGDADLLIIHDPVANAEFMAAGHGARSRKLMSNEFLLVGPDDDPAGIRGLNKADDALKKIRTSDATFVSRGDDSGTHKRELEIWRWAGLDPHGGDPRQYREVGGGMGKTLNVAAALNAYTLVDRGTWLSFKNRQQLVALCAGDPRLLNTYTVLEINFQKHPYIRQNEARVLADWLVGRSGQQLIDDFRIEGRRLFDPVNQGLLTGPDNRYFLTSKVKGLVHDGFQTIEYSCSDGVRFSNNRNRLIGTAAGRRDCGGRSFAG